MGKETAVEEQDRVRRAECRATLACGEGDLGRLGRAWLAGKRQPTGGEQPVVDIEGRPCWGSGSGDGYVPISLSNCQKSNLVSAALAGLGLNGGRQAWP